MPGCLFSMRSVILPKQVTGNPLGILAEHLVVDVKV